jgi:hypothetical protein
MSGYTSIPGFEDIYLEDSWILGIRAEPGSVFLDLDVVLNESHPAYAPPMPGEQYCYRRGAIRFEHVDSLTWTRQTMVVPAIDASGEPDFGSIDEFEIGQGQYTIEGDFGRLEITSSRPTIELTRRHHTH